MFINHLFAIIVKRCHNSFIYVALCNQKTLYHTQDWLLVCLSYYNMTFCYHYHQCHMSCHDSSINIVVVQVQLRTEVPSTPRSTQSWLELMTSRPWQYILCHWDVFSNHSAISDFYNLGQKYQAPQVWPNRGSNSWPPDNYIQTVLSGYHIKSFKWELNNPILPVSLGASWSDIATTA